MRMIDAEDITDYWVESESSKYEIGECTLSTRGIQGKTYHY